MGGSAEWDAITYHSAYASAPVSPASGDLWLPSDSPMLRALTRRQR